MRRDYPATLSSPVAAFSLRHPSFSFLHSSILFSPFSYVSFLSPLNQEGVHNAHCVLVPLVLFLCSRSVTLRCCTESRCWGPSVTLTRPSPLDWPNDPSPLRCHQCTCTTDSTQTCFLLFPTCSFMWQCSYRGTFAPSLSLLRCWSHIFLFEFPFSLPESPPLVLPSFIE